jgi:hypothetical protein
MKGFPCGIRGEARTNQTRPYRTTGAASADHRPGQNSPPRARGGEPPSSPPQERPRTRERSGVSSQRQKDPQDQQLDSQLTDNWIQNSPTEPPPRASPKDHRGGPSRIRHAHGVVARQPPATRTPRNHHAHRQRRTRPSHAHGEWRLTPRRNPKASGGSSGPAALTPGKRCGRGPHHRRNRKPPPAQGEVRMPATVAGAGNRGTWTRGSPGTYSQAPRRLWRNLQNVRGRGGNEPEASNPPAITLSQATTPHRPAGLRLTAPGTRAKCPRRGRPTCRPHQPRQGLKASGGSSGPAVALTPDTGTPSRPGTPPRPPAPQVATPPGIPNGDPRRGTRRNATGRRAA